MICISKLLKSPRFHVVELAYSNEAVELYRPEYSFFKVVPHQTGRLENGKTKSSKLTSGVQRLKRKSMLPSDNQHLRRYCLPVTERRRKRSLLILSQLASPHRHFGVQSQCITDFCRKGCVLQASVSFYFGSVVTLPRLYDL